MLLDLPEALVASFLFEWLELKDLVRLESAYCRKSSRSQLLSLLSSEHHVYNQSIYDRARPPDYQLRWSVAHKFRLSYVCIDCREENVAFVIQLLEYSGSTIRNFSASRCFNPRQSRIILCNALATHCKHLTFLSISDIDDEEITIIARGCLELQSIRSWSDLTDIGVLELAHNCKQLRIINCIANTKITDASLVPLFENCRQLETIKLIGCVATDVALEAIAKNSSELRDFELIFSAPTTAAGVELVKKHCVKIKHFVYCNCVEI